MSSSEKNFLKIDVPKDKFNNLNKVEQDALYNLKNDKTIVIKGADKGSAVVVWDREDYIFKEAENQLGDINIYEEVPKNTKPFLNIILNTLESICKRGDVCTDIYIYIYIYIYIQQSNCIVQKKHPNTQTLENMLNKITGDTYCSLGLQSMTKIMRKTAIWAISCFYSLPPLNNVEKQWAKLVSTYVMGSQHCTGGEGGFYIISKIPIIFCHWL